MGGEQGLSISPIIDKLETLNISTVPEIPVYKPTLSEFEDFSKCISAIESRGAHHIGICKVIPPSTWICRRKGYGDIGEYIVDKPILQTSHGSRGIFLQDISSRKSLSFNNFKSLALSKTHCTPSFRDFDHLERMYWSSIFSRRPLYGANVSGTLMDDELNVWNISKLDSILSRVFQEEGVRIPGVNTPYLYYGMWSSTFPWHVEDVDLYSINYLHYGLPKWWYVIPPAFARKFEAFVSEYFRSEFLKCNCFLRHKCVLISPTVLLQAGIPTRKIVQYEGEFMITFPYAYHCGFNTGLNIAESSNFALARWIEYGKHAKICKCWDDTVKICMDPFVRRFQPELFGDWKLGKNPRPHPLDAYMIKDINRLSEDTIHPDSKSLKADLRRVASGSSAPVERPPFKLKLPRPGDLNLIDLRYSSKQFKEAKLPYHIAANPHLYHLWCGNPANEQNERTFNNFIGSHKPHCAICSFLWTPQHISKLLSTEHRDKNLPMYSDPHLPEVAYHDFHSSSVQFPQAVKSRIIRCLHCSLTVHTRCYGIKDETLLNEDSSVTEKISWICDACKADGKPTCVFCYMRGGAMKALMNINNSYTGRPYWAHVICALATPGCHFKDVPQRLAFISEDTIKTAINSAELYYNVRNDRNAICENNFPMEMRQSDSTRFANSNNIAKNLRLAHKRPHDSNSYGECYGNGLRECSQTSQESGVYGKNKASHFSRKLCRNQTVVIYPSVGSLKLSNRHNKDLLSSDDDSDHHSHHRKTDITTKSEKIATLFSSKCTVCGLPGRGFLPLAPCWYDGCPARFHVTCAQMAGIVIGTDVYPRFFYIACRKHPTNYSHPGFRDQDSVSPGDNVMVQRNRNLIFSPAVAIRRVTPPYCRISFPDGTFSSDTPPEYLTNIDWSKDGPPTKGSIVKVLWDDGIEYVGTFEGTTSEQWEVQLESGEVKVFNREQFYVQPKKKCKQSVDLNDDSDDNSLRPSCS